MKKAIEVEYWVTDLDGVLTPSGSLTDVSAYVEEEFVDPLIELKTPPCDSYADLEATFLDQLTELVAEAADRDRRLVPLATPINGAAIDQRPSERTRIQRSVLGEHLAYANHCAGTHIHFEKRNVTDQLNVLLAMDPALALVNSSPYFEGNQVAAGARSHVYRQKCYERFPRHGQLWNYVESVGEWERRLETCFEEFEVAALDAGVDEAEFAANFSQESAVWTPVRLRDEMPTVEWRSPDTTLPSQVLRLVREVDSVMCQVDDAVVTVDGEGRRSSDGIVLPSFEHLAAYANDAIHEGIDSAAVSGYLRRMGFDVEAYDPISRQIGGKGPVDPAAARQLRLAFARRLERDLEGLVAAQSVI